ncbi:hypothetical protein [Haloferula sp. BvORR071]|uniref:hypothetical protein n=1 Tax=Haloferula sp. BvORR071 TaxID=1396141 RepID=UPI002240ED31|nr:hypothetical protein [Haloferula sp. BvORR071]
MSDWNLFERIVVDAMEAQKYPEEVPRLCDRRLRGPLFAYSGFYYSPRPRQFGGSG